MSRDNHHDVGLFHTKFGLHETISGAAGPVPIPMGLLEFRLKFLKEELEEFEEGMDEDDMAKMADALVDLVYVAMGTAHLLGLPWEALWNEVQRVNMQKVRAAKDGSNSKRGSGFDVVKPEGWTPPDIQGVLKAFGFDVPGPTSTGC